MTLQFSVRSIHLNEDAIALSALHTACFLEGWKNTAFTTMPQNTVGFLAENQHEIMGLIVCTIAADQADIVTLCAHKTYRQQGVASVLLKQLIVFLTQQGVGKLFLEVAKENLAAIAFYTRHTFTKVGERRGYYAVAGKGKGDAVVMMKTLS